MSKQEEPPEGRDDDFESRVVVFASTSGAATPRWARTMLRSKLDGKVYMPAAAFEVPGLSGIQGELAVVLACSQATPSTRCSRLQINGATEPHWYIEVASAIALFPEHAKLKDFLRAFDRPTLKQEDN